MDKPSHRTLENNGAPSVDGPDYLSLVIEWDKMADALEEDGMSAAPTVRMSIPTRDPDWDSVDQASFDSFPASDPPAWGSAHATTQDEEDFQTFELEGSGRPSKRMMYAKRIAIGVLAVGAAVAIAEGVRRYRDR